MLPKTVPSLLQTASCVWGHTVCEPQSGWGAKAKRGS